MKTALLTLLTACLMAQTVDKVIPLSTDDSEKFRALQKRFDDAKKAHENAFEALSAAENEFSEKNCPKHWNDYAVLHQNGKDFSDPSGPFLNPPMYTCQFSKDYKYFIVERRK